MGPQIYEEEVDHYLALQTFEIKVGIKKVRKPTTSKEIIQTMKASYPEPTYNHLTSLIRSLECTINIKLHVDLSYQSHPYQETKVIHLAKGRKK